MAKEERPNAPRLFKKTELLFCTCFHLGACSRWQWRRQSSLHYQQRQKQRQYQRQTSGLAGNVVVDVKLEDVVAWVRIMLACIQEVYAMAVGRPSSAAAAVVLAVAWLDEAQLFSSHYL